MDNLTHTLIGVGAAQAGLSRRFGRGTLLTLILASNLPDLDVLWSFLAGGDAFLSRRMFTHSLFGAPLLSAALAGLLRPVYRDKPWKTLFGLALIGAGLHVFFDLVNSYGVALFYPFSRRRVELAWIFIIDLVIWAIVLTPALLRLVPRLRPWSEALGRGSLLALALYVALCGASRARAARILEKTAAEQGVRPSFSYVFPEALGCHRFRGVLREGDEYGLHLIHAWSGRAELKRTFHTEAERPEVRAARALPLARKLEWFFKAPVWRTGSEEGRRWAEVFDLRFTSVVLDWRKSPFAFRFPLSDELKTSGPSPALPAPGTD